MPDMPPSRALLAVDVEKYTANQGPTLPAIRATVRTALSEALRRWGLDWDRDVADAEDTGDGFLIVLTDDRTHLLIDAVEDLNRQLRRIKLSGGPALRMRAAVHTGPVHEDGAATAKSRLCRLLETDILRQALAATRSHVALVVSDAVFQTAVMDGYTDVDAESFRQVHDSVKGMPLSGWIYTPAMDLPTTFASRPDGSAAATKPPAPTPDTAATAQPEPVAPVFHIGSQSGNQMMGGTVHGGMNYNATTEHVHGRKGDNVAGDKKVRGGRDA
ncbi:hypothetical protein OG783_33385 [Streptomyces jietaisiensis]|uniref:hypothetical protein n=1 Tax=Streptomyces griseoaurantiacus TaxID=68213 RepID=UPI0032556F3F